MEPREHQMEVVEEQAVDAADATIASSITQAMEGIERTSRPPSPPTRPDSPANDLLPLRLQLYTPAKNYGAVAEHTIFRSAFPQDRNLRFLECLNVKTVLCFVETEPTPAYVEYIQTNSITHKRVPVLANKDGNVAITVESVCEALLVTMDIANYPLYIHCNQGKHRTGCVIACMRKVQGWSMDDILHEYDTYASPKARAGDIEFITNVFQPAALLEHATRHGDFSHRPALKTLLSIKALTLEKLIEILGSEEGIESSDTSLRSAESKADSGIDLSGAAVDPSKVSDWLEKFDVGQATENAVMEGEVAAAEVSVMECEDVMSPPPAAGEQSFFASMA
ncbi:tyrosine-protein phosphatase siw14 [Oleoguttula sp. CCFEE 5521]